MKDTVVITSSTEDYTDLIEILKKKNRLLYTISTEDNNNIDTKAKYVICIGPLTKLAKYLEDKDNTLKSIIVFGGFIGSNILIEDYLPKEFKGKQLIKDDNLSYDVDSSLKVFHTTQNQVNQVYMFSYNILNYVDKIDIINETLNILSDNTDRLFKYIGANPEYNKELNMWGSGLYLLFVAGRTRMVQVSTGKKDEY